MKLVHKETSCVHRNIVQEITTVTTTRMYVCVQPALFKHTQRLRIFVTCIVSTQFKLSENSCVIWPLSETQEFIGSIETFPGSRNRHSVYFDEPLLTRLPWNIHCGRRREYRKLRVAEESLRLWTKIKWPT